MNEEAAYPNFGLYLLLITYYLLLQPEGRGKKPTLVKFALRRVWGMGCKPIKPLAGVIGNELKIYKITYD